MPVNVGPYERCLIPVHDYGPGIVGQPTRRGRGMPETDVHHYMGDHACDCGDTHHDPVSGLCLGCDPILYRVSAFVQDEDYPDWAQGVTVSRRGLAAEVNRYFDLDCDLVVIQREGD